MRKTRPAAAEPMMRGSFSWILVLYSSIKRRNTHMNRVPYTLMRSLKLKHMGKHLSHCIWRERWVTDRHTAGWTNEHLGILTGCMDHFPKHTECVQMPRIRTNHLAESVWSEQREHVWVRPRPIRQPRAGFQLLNGHTQAEPDPSLEHCKWHDFPILARHTSWWVPCSALCFWTALILYSTGQNPYW